MELINVDGLKNKKLFRSKASFKYVECDKEQASTNENGCHHNVLPGGKIIEVIMVDN